MLRKLIFLIVFLAIIFSPHFASSDSSGRNMIVLFSPRDECGKVILNKINEAKKTIDIAMYYFTSRPLAQALIEAKRRGVEVRVFLDGEGAKEYYSKANFLKKNKIPLKLEKGEGLMHNKFCIIDNVLLVTGSYNWTASADLRNDENMMLIDSKEIIELYKVQFEKYWRGTYVDKAYYINKKTLEKAGSR